MNFDEQTYEMIEAYLAQTLSGSERISFEERIKADTNLATEVAICREMHIQYGNAYNTGIYVQYDQEVLTDLKDHLKSEEIHKLSKKIKKGKKIYDDTTNKKPLITYFYYTAAAIAAIAVIFLISTLFTTTNTSSQELYVEYKDWNELPSLTSKGDDQNSLSKGETIFFEGKYTEVILLFNDLEYIKNPHVLTYLGLSYLESNDFDNALNTFDQLLKSDTLDNHKAYWYISMAYLKQGNRKKAIEQLQLLRSNKNNYKYKKAGKLLSELNNE